MQNYFLPFKVRILEAITLAISISSFNNYLPITWQTESLGNLSINFINRKTQLYIRFLNSILKFALSFFILRFTFLIYLRHRP